MLYLTCTTITSVDLAHYGVSRAKDWVSVYCGTNIISSIVATEYREATFQAILDMPRLFLEQRNASMLLPQIIFFSEFEANEYTLKRNKNAASKIWNLRFS